MQYNEQVKPLQEAGQEEQEDRAAYVVARFIRFVALKKKLEKEGDTDSVVATGLARFFGKKKQKGELKGEQAERRHRARRHSSLSA